MRENCGMSRTDARAAVSHQVELGDGRVLHARVWPGHGAPLVLLHGLLDSADGWTSLCQATSRPCVAFDLAGFGASDLPTHPAFSAYAVDVIAGIDELIAGDFVLVGHSLGGAVATAIAERIPDRVCALVLLAPAGFGRIGLAELISIPGVRNATEFALPLALRNRTLVGTAYRVLVANRLAAADDIVDRVVDHGHLVAGAREATKAVVRGGLSKRAFHRRTVDYDGPVTVVWGDRDRLVPIAHLAGVATAFPHVDAQVWPGMGHHPQRERPDELLMLVETCCGPQVRRPNAGGGRRRRRVNGAPPPPLRRRAA